MGFMEDLCKTVPKAESKCVGVIFFILNIIIPGTGTIFAAINQNCIGVQIIVGILQFFSSPILFIGWVWSIIWGYKIFEKSGSQLPKDIEAQENPTKQATKQTAAN